MKNFVEFKKYNAIALKAVNKYYVYDSYSNEIFETEKIIIDILDDSEMSLNDLFLKYNKKGYTLKKLKNAIHDINYLKTHLKILSTFKFEKLSLTEKKDSSNKVNKKLDNQLTQLVFNVTENCNLRCDYCVYSGIYEGSRVHNNSKILTNELGLKVVDFFVKHSSKSKEKYISFYGGEPLLNFNFIKEIIEYTNKIDKTIVFFLTSNGVLINEEIVSFFEKYSVELTLSIDGPEFIHDSSRKTINGKGTFTKVMSILKMIKEKFHNYYNEHLKVNSVVYPKNAEHYNLLMNFFNDPIFDFIRKKSNLAISVANYSESLEKFNFSNNISIFNDKVNKCIKKFNISELYKNEHLIFNAFNSKWFKMLHYRDNARMNTFSFYWPNGICIPGMRSLFVSSEGSFYPCEKLYDTKDMIIGNIDKGFDKDKINEYIDEYKKLMTYYCSNCWAFRFCGECFLGFYKNGKYNISERIKKCDMNKKFWVSFIKEYAVLIDEDKTVFDFLEKTDPGQNVYVNEMIND